MKTQYEKQLQEKDDYIAKLRGQLQKNSSNSSKPSSTDGFKKLIHNSREKIDLWKAKKQSTMMMRES